MSRSNRSKERRNARGLTLLEMVIMVTILIMVFQAITSSTMMLARSGQYGRAKNRTLAQAQMLLEKTVNELRLSSTGVDPFSGRPFSLVEGPEEDPALRFRRVVNFGDSSGELGLIWSSDVLYSVVDGVLTRTQDGADRVMLRGVTDHDFTIDTVGRFKIELSMQVPQASGPPEMVNFERTVDPVF